MPREYRRRKKNANGNVLNGKRLESPSLLATVNDENPCDDRGLDAGCPPVALDSTKDEKWRRRESNPQIQSRNSQVAQRLWNMLQDVGVSWEWKDDANW
jgi:hypothetical protein